MTRRSRRALKTYRPELVWPPFEHNRVVAKRRAYRRLVKATDLAMRRMRALAIGLTRAARPLGTVTVPSAALSREERP